MHLVRDDGGAAMSCYNWKAPHSVFVIQDRAKSEIRREVNMFVSFRHAAPQVNVRQLDQCAQARASEDRGTVLAREKSVQT